MIRICSIGLHVYCEVRNGFSNICCVKVVFKNPSISSVVLRGPKTSAVFVLKFHISLYAFRAVLAGFMSILPHKADPPNVTQIRQNAALPIKYPTQRQKMLMFSNFMVRRVD